MRCLWSGFTAIAGIQRCGSRNPTRWKSLICRSISARTRYDDRCDLRGRPLFRKAVSLATATRAGEPGYTPPVLDAEAHGYEAISVAAMVGSRSCFVRRLPAQISPASKERSRATPSPNRHSPRSDFHRPRCQRRNPVCRAVSAASDEFSLQTLWRHVSE